MFGWFKDKGNEKPGLENSPLELQFIGGLLKGIQRVENLLRMGRDQDAVEQLQIMTPASIKLLQKVKIDDHLFNLIAQLVDLLLQARQMDLAKQLLHPLVDIAKSRGDKDVMVVHSLLAKIGAIAQTKVDTPTQAISVVYACQHCGWMNCFITEPCMKCGFIPREDTEMRLAMFLSNEHLHINYLPALGNEITRGRKLNDVLPDFETNFDKFRVPPDVLKMLISNAKSTKNRSSKYPSIQSLAQCDKCGGTMRFSNDTACQSCGNELRLPALLRFAISTSRVAESIQKLLAPSDSPAFGRLICLLVMFEAAAFQEGKVPTQGERTDALSTMRSLKHLDTRDGAMRVIFEANDISIGINQDATKQRFSEAKLMMQLGEWIAFHRYMREGIALR